MTKKEAIQTLCGFVLAKEAEKETLQAAAVCIKALARDMVHKARNAKSRHERGVATTGTTAAAAAAAAAAAVEAVASLTEGGAK